MGSKTRRCVSCGEWNKASKSCCGNCSVPLFRPTAFVVRIFSGPQAGIRFLIGLCLLNFVTMILMDGVLPLGLFGPSANRRAIVGAGAVSGSLSLVQPWRLLSANYVHVSALHLVLNLYALHSLGSVFERRFGGVRLLVLYSTTGMMGLLLSSYLYHWSGPLTAGASAGLFGFIGVEVGEFARRRNFWLRDLFFQHLFFAVALALFAPVNNFAHLGGFIGGLGLGLLVDCRTSPGSGVVGKGLAVLSALGALVAMGLSALFPPNV